MPVRIPLLVENLVKTDISIKAEQFFPFIHKIRAFSRPLSARESLQKKLEILS